jgi:DNA-binding NarL/FixJ family response regulator
MRGSQWLPEVSVGWDACPVLVHREEEFGAIERWLSGVEEGEGGVALLEGPAGIGKTALLRAVRERAEDIGLTVLHACGGELERSAAWAVARELLLPGLTALDERDRQELWNGPAAPAAALLGGAVAEDWHGPDQAFRVAHALTWVVVALAARRPLVLLVDDAHWGDPPSLRWLEFLARRLDGVRTLVVFAARPAEGFADRTLELLAARARVLRPRPLGPDAVHEVVAAHFGGRPEPEFVAACHEVTGGNPFLLTELLRDAGEARLAPHRSQAQRVRGLRPASVRRLALLRLASLGLGAIDLARAVALLGDGTVPTTAGALAGLSERAVIAAAEALAAAQIFTNDPELSFVHPLIRSVIYEDIAPAARAIWHRKAARLLAKRGAPAGSVAAQLLLAERTGDPWAVARLLDSARAARRRGAPEVACELAERALGEPPSPELRATVLRELASAELDLGKVEGLAHLREALAGASSGPERAQLALLLGPTLTVLNHHEEAVGLLAESLDELVPDTQPELYAALEAELIAATLAVSGTVHAARKRIEIALARREGWMLELDRPILALLGFEAIGQGRIEDGLLLARHALSRPASPSHGMPVTVNFGAAALRWADQLDEALKVWSHEVEDARRRSAPLRLAWASDNRAIVLLRRGEVAAAEADARTAVELMDALYPRPISVALGTHAEALLETGAASEAVELIGRALLGDSYAESDSVFRAEPLRVRARIRAWQGDLRGALADLERIERLAARYGFVNPGATPWRAQAALLHGALGDNEHALRLVEEDLTQARNVESQRALGTALRVRGLLRKEAGLEDLSEAVAILAAGQDRLEHIRALVDLGAALRRAGRRSGARPALREALHLAASGGATALASAARTELLASGARPRRDESRGRDALTASERRIAMLAAEGRSNREIAQALFVTLRTVETHLTHAYSKLGVARREHLPGAL